MITLLNVLYKYYKYFRTPQNEIATSTAALRVFGLFYYNSRPCRFPTIQTNNIQYN